MSDTVRLRPVLEDDLGVIERLTQDPGSTGEFSWFGWYGLRRWRSRWEENGLLDDDGGVLIVVEEAESLGFVNFRRRALAVAGLGWEIGIALLPDARGKGHGAVAQRLLVEYLFAHTTAHRVEAATEVDNHAEQRALEKAGFTREGVIRGGGWRDGAFRDGVVYSFLRTDLPG